MAFNNLRSFQVSRERRATRKIAGHDMNPVRYSGITLTGDPGNRIRGRSPPRGRVATHGNPTT
eukprot:5359164-Pleurochrysis_carterae.AAC.1